ncbi:DUF5345 family protein [Paenibacillus koleovorans]|uniref:DUF5345 family protein n=1 Tax=Paenibacillus koleovorans TaxID=121608 RepID=UPI000FDAAB69|nr:DUF5345 family protein [Paenibacillus koleovorans]
MRSDDRNKNTSPSPEWELDFKQQLGKLDNDERFPVPIPDLADLERMIAQQQNQLKRTLLRDLLLFWLAALFLVGIVFAVVYRTPLLFAWLQLPILLLGLSIWLAIRIRNRGWVSRE